MRRIFAALYMKEDARASVLLVSSDMEKAFDRVAWPYMFRILEYMGLGGFFGDVLRVLYSNLQGQILVNDSLTDAFPVRRGTRQGCPLSPLLYVLTLEPLLECIRTHPRLVGERIGISEF